MARPREPHLAKAQARSLRNLVRLAATEAGIAQYQLVSADYLSPLAARLSRAMENARPMSAVVAVWLWGIAYRAHKSQALGRNLLAFWNDQKSLFESSGPAQMIVFRGSSSAASEEISERLAGILGLDANRAAKIRRFLRVYLGTYERANDTQIGRRALNALGQANLIDSDGRAPLFVGCRRKGSDSVRKAIAQRKTLRRKDP